jgi:hypothetical protein
VTTGRHSIEHGREIEDIVDSAVAEQRGGGLAADHLVRRAEPFIAILWPGEELLQEALHSSRVFMAAWVRDLPVVV